MFLGSNQTFGRHTPSIPHFFLTRSLCNALFHQCLNIAFEEEVDSSGLPQPIEIVDFLL